MSKQFTIITKDGSKWLRPVNPFDNNDPRFTSKEPFCILGMRPCSKTVCECDEWKKFEKNNPILPYIGSRPEGTVLDESQVRKITQVEDYPEWITPHPDNLEDWLDTSHEIRTVYVDAEPECPECGKYCSCPEEDLYDAVADYRKNHPEPSHDRHISESEYWKMRALSAEKLIEMEPSDPKTYDEFCRLRNEWESIKSKEPK